MRTACILVAAVCEHAAAPGTRKRAARAFPLDETRERRRICVSQNQTEGRNARARLPVAMLSLSVRINERGSRVYTPYRG